MNKPARKPEIVDGGFFSRAIAIRFAAIGFILVSLEPILAGGHRIAPNAKINAPEPCFNASWRDWRTNASVVFLGFFAARWQLSFRTNTKKTKGGRKGRVFYIGVLMSPKFLGRSSKSPVGQNAHDQNAHS